jgi:hypothetical protein
MTEYYSKNYPDMLLHIVTRLEDADGRRDIIPPHEHLQCASLKMSAGHTFKPHKHILKPPPTELVRAQESWVVIRGGVLCTLYDIDDTILAKVGLGAGDASFTLRGGHTYEILEDNTIVYEYKTGPYTGQEHDKEFI